MSIIQPVLLTDQNIELICGQMRTILQQNAMQMESDLPLAPRKRLEIPMTLTLNKESDSGFAVLEMTYQPIVRKDRVRINLEDHRQQTLLRA